MQTSKDLTFDEFHEPIWYCRNCHSIAIINDASSAVEGWDGSYCSKCHSTDIGVTQFGKWLREEERVQRRKQIMEWNK